MTNSEVLDFLRNEAEVKVFNLSNGEPFAIVIKSDEIDTVTLEHISKSFKTAYEPTKNKVAIMVVGINEDVNYITLTEMTEKVKRRK